MLPPIGTGCKHGTDTSARWQRNAGRDSSRALLHARAHDPPAESEVTVYESVERHLLGLATALRVQHSEHSVGMVQSFHFPDFLPAIAAVLLEHARAGGLQARRKLRTEGFGAVV